MLKFFKQWEMYSFMQTFYLQAIDYIRLSGTAELQIHKIVVIVSKSSDVFLVLSTVTAKFPFAFAKRIPFTSVLIWTPFPRSRDFLSLGLLFSVGEDFSRVP